jgi:hypothetical protein
MITTARSVAIIFVGPPLVLFTWAHLLHQNFPGSSWAGFFAAGVIGLAGVASAPWSNTMKIFVATAYIGLGVVILPFLTLLAVCSTGDCL